MGLETGPFDLYELSVRINSARVDRELTWAQLSREVGVAVSTIRRFATANDAEADGVLALIGWLGVAPELFIVDSTVAGLRLPPAGEGMIRVDMERVRLLTSARSRQSTRTSSRTTIQRLATAAQASELPVSSLTKVERLLTGQLNTASIVSRSQLPCIVGGRFSRENQLA